MRCSTDWLMGQVAGNLLAYQRMRLVSEAEMSAPPQVRLERLPKRDAVIRLRAVYACLEQGWQRRQRVAIQRIKKRLVQEERS